VALGKNPNAIEKVLNNEIEPRPEDKEWERGQEAEGRKRRARVQETSITK
jgi:hypothetical protein